MGLGMQLDDLIEEEPAHSQEKTSQTFLFVS